MHNGSGVKNSRGIITLLHKSLLLPNNFCSMVRNMHWNKSNIIYIFFLEVRLHGNKASEKGDEEFQYHKWNVAIYWYYFGVSNFFNLNH